MRPEARPGRGIPPELALRRLVTQVERIVRVHGRALTAAAREDLERAAAEARRSAGLEETP